MFINFAKQARNKQTAQQLYGSIVAQARQPYFYRDLNVPDTATCRFEMIVLHMFVLLKSLNEKVSKNQDFSQILIETFFSDMDSSLREMGVGDLTVPKKMRKLANAFYARLDVYSKAVEMTDLKELVKALDINFLENTDSPESNIVKIKGHDLAVYVMTLCTHISKYSVEELQKSMFDFPDIAGPEFIKTALASSQE